MDIQGSIVAIVTPFKNGEIDEAAFRNLIDWQVAEGTDGIVVAGTTGESPTLSTDEHHKIVELAIKFADGQVPVIAGTGSNSTREAVALTVHAKNAGADASLVVNPYYNKPTQEGLIRHYNKIADAADLPLIVYNIPARSVGKVNLDTMIDLSRHENIVGVKDAVGNLAETARLLAAVPDFLVLSGDDLVTLQMMAIGGKGVISVAANIIPKQMSKIAGAALKGDFNEAKATFNQNIDLISAMGIEVNPIPVKTSLAMMGKVAEEFRLPLCEMATENRNKLEPVLKSAGLI